MSHFLTFVTNENGVIVDPQMRSELDVMMSATFGFNDLNIYSHGWWNDATAALNTYNQFSVGYSNQIHLAATRPQMALGALPQTVLNVGIHWPSMLSESSGALVNLLEAASFFTMEKRADDVGETGVYALLLAVIQQRQAAAPNFRINLIGHSFGCKVICSALQRLATTCAGSQVGLNMIDFNVVLLQAAFDDNDLEQGELYGQMAVGLPNLRVLVTKSALDSALCNMFPLAHRLEFFHPNAGKVAMGAAGPSVGTVNRFGGCQSVQVTSGIDFTTMQPFAQRLVCADLQPLHAANTSYPSGPSGHHTDIYHDEIYGLIARFLY